MLSSTEDINTKVHTYTKRKIVLASFKFALTPIELELETTH